jgi:putative ABC transport system permease protein
VATVGLYSILAFDVLQRTREIGIRTALGAERGHVLRGVLVSGGRMVALGCLIGVAVAFLAAPQVQPLLFNVSGRDPLVIAGVTVVLLTVGCLSSLPPALWATRIDPVEALRQE